MVICGESLRARWCLAPSSASSAAFAAAQALLDLTSAPATVPFIRPLSAYRYGDDQSGRFASICLTRHARSARGS